MLLFHTWEIVFITRKLNASFKNNYHETITYRNFKTFNENDFRADLESISWTDLNTCETVDSCLELWQTKFVEIVDKHLPLHEKRVSRGRFPGRSF